SAVHNTPCAHRWMSALPPKADKEQTSRDVRFVPKADSCTAANDVRDGTRTQLFNRLMASGRSTPIGTRAMSKARSSRHMNLFHAPGRDGRCGGRRRK